MMAFLSPSRELHTSPADWQLKRLLLTAPTPKTRREPWYPIKKLLVKLGPICGDGLIEDLDSAVSYLSVGHWMRIHNFRLAKPARSREDLFDLVATRFADERVLYLEFGVAFGESMRYWARLLRNGASHLHGFDSFEGLPSDWNRSLVKGAFSTGGSIPDIPDGRVKFFKGLFEEMLPLYSFPEYKVLVINIDCDLYASAAFVLTYLKKRIQRGTYISFDEFCDRANELRAFHDFIGATGKHFQLVGASETFRHVMFQCVE